MANNDRPTYGEYLVGISFNPGQSEEVADVKRKAADFIDAIERIVEKSDTEAQQKQIRRLKALAVTHAENAAMWAVKAATKPAE